MSRDKDLLEETLANLIARANKDGKITEDEFNIINQVSLDTKKYLDMLDEARKDGVITKEEGKELRNLKNEILERAEEVAVEDGMITEEEEALIKKLIYILTKRYKKY